MIFYFSIVIYCALYAQAYRNKLFTLVTYSDFDATHCRTENGKTYIKHSMDGVTPLGLKMTYKTVPPTTEIKTDPIINLQKTISRILFGSKGEELEYDLKINKLSSRIEKDNLAQYHSGNIFRGELFHNRSIVHLPFSEFMFKGHSYLQVTKDYMQTAVNAFAIFLDGDVDDILRLPADYVLRSARTIAMMKIPREKLVATWKVVKDGLLPIKVNYNVLAMYRPLFKYVNGREMANLNLSNTKILNYIGTHPDIDRHQVGVVANKYININPHWKESRYLNLMNNLICGLPIRAMQILNVNTYLQLSSQIFHHTRACDPLQRRFYLSMMTRTQVLGKSYSWSARDVFRLGLLLTEVNGQDLSAMNPKAMAGITAEVMLQLTTEKLRYITHMHIKYMQPKALEIYARKLKKYREELIMLNNLSIVNNPVISFPTLLLILIKYLYIF